MRQAPKARSQRAFTLIETAMSMYILLIGVLVFSGMAVFSNKIALQAKVRSSAYQVARGQMDVLKTTDFDKLMPMTDVTFDIPQELIDTLPGANNAKYETQGIYSISDRSMTQKQLDVRIKWRNASSPEGQIAPWSEVRLGTILTRPGSVTNPITTPGGTP
ncbi:hypothetical protein CCB80_00750 [Armatimonadetes bacterium Uphvl-Ar1]|nr:hypothetical protein CCB80_00750 [Armatimonadetes bacterium Uphvl-Ar1]